jgi:hypothetical protein
MLEMGCKGWIAANWVRGAGFMAAALIAAAPVIGDRHGLSLLLIFLHSPAYMVHQVEEHAADRFRRFVNDRLFGGIDALTTKGVLWINLPGVWGLNLMALYAACFATPGDALAAPYLVLVNALTHVGAAIRVRGTNPGLFTAVFVLAPLGCLTLARTEASQGQHALGLGIAIMIHVAIVLGTVARARRLRMGAMTP